MGRIGFQRGSATEANNNDDDDDDDNNSNNNNNRLETFGLLETVKQMRSKGEDRGKPEYPEKNLSEHEQRREPTKSALL